MVGVEVHLDFRKALFSSLTGATICCSDWQMIRLERRAEDHIVGWSGFKAAWEVGIGAKIW